MAVIDELKDSRDQYEPAKFHDLVAWLDPDAGPFALWTFEHVSGNPNHGTGIAGKPCAGASWMAAEEQSGRLGIGFQESVPNLSLNNFTLTCDNAAKDGDTTDSLPVWMDFEAGPVLDFDGVGFAVETDDAGMVVASGHVFFRVSEADDATDYNADGDKTDVILMRNPKAACAPTAMATSHGQEGPVIITDGLYGAAFLSSEFMAGVAAGNSCPSFQ